MCLIYDYIGRCYVLLFLYAFGILSVPISQIYILHLIYKIYHIIVSYFMYFDVVHNNTNKHVVLIFVYLFYTLY